MRPLNFNGVKVDDHLFCLLDGAKSYLLAMEENWARLIRFIVFSQINEAKYFGIRGTEILNLTNYEEEGRILARGKSQLVLKTREGKIQVVCCCQIPCLTIRLVVMANEDDIPVEADSEYADKVVGYLADQIDACWKVLPQLLNRNNLFHMYVRKFERYTATLQLGGQEDSGINDSHKQPMKDQLSSLNKLNFNSEHMREQWNKLPHINKYIYKAKLGYDNTSCCKDDDEFSNSGFGDETDSEDDNTDRDENNDSDNDKDVGIDDNDENAVGEN